MVESSIISYCNRIIDYQIGTPVQVEFDFNKVWNLKKERGSSFQFKTLKMTHVHPNNIFDYSENDRQVIKGWTLAFGYSFTFNIVCFRNDNLFNVDCGIISYKYNKIEDKVEKIISVNNDSYMTQYICRDHLIILKLLSYGVKFDIEKMLDEACNEEFKKVKTRKLKVNLIE